MRAALRTRCGVAAALVLAAACVRPSGPPAPEAGFAPVSLAEFRAMAALTTPGAFALLAIRWRYDDGESPVHGRGAVRVAPPDSLRLDVGVPIIGRATLVLAGDSAWSKPGALVSQWMPSRGILWAMFGVVRPPGDLASVEWGQTPDRQLYRVTAADGIVTTLELRGDTLLGVTQARGDRSIGRLALTRNSAGMIVRAEATDFEHSVRFTVDVDHREVGGPFPNEIWRRP